MDISFFWVGAGLAFLGYFIGDGLKNFNNSKGSFSGYPTLIKERDLYLYLGLSKEEVNELLSKFPDAPKVELKGTTYYPYQHFLEWFSSIDIYKR
ncbi:DNA-binding protein [Neobacillus sp. YIM B06451]|uniref:DNA-binding protein n=1 Tax=Neobacillus sp. YIM B06451 TaxID=3070994 RepID=UPI0029314A46|nr:DNA-binding protein [Neobacillus sp. YIM B06451]